MGSLERRRARNTKYIRVRELGRGGMATTYLATRWVAAVQENQRVCVKDVHELEWRDPEFRDAFLSEMRILMTLRSSNIVSVIDVDPRLGRLVLELVAGADLRQAVERQPGRRLSVDLVAPITYAVCRGLGVAHRRRHRGVLSGIVHRDVSPSNVLISYEGDVKLTDFGLATTIKTRGEPHSELVRGKINYFSPEQSRGEILDGRSDLFAVGVMVYELLTGVRPFDGPTDEDTLRACRAGMHRPLSDYGLDGPPEFFALIEQMLETDRNKRPPHCEAVLDAIERLRMPHRWREIGRLANAARPDHTVFESSSLGPRRSSQLRWMGVAAAAALVTSGGIGVSQTLSRPTPTPAIKPDRTFQTPSVAQTAAAAMPSTTALAPPTPRDDASDQQPVMLAGIGRVEPAVGSPAQAALAVAPGRNRGSARKPMRSERGVVPVTVNSMPAPPGFIWIDGKREGRGPVNATLTPGRHSFAAGLEQPERTIWLDIQTGGPGTVVIDREAP